MAGATGRQPGNGQTNDDGVIPCQGDVNHDYLGQRHQVLCVTHLPQVAARGGAHYQVSKAEKAGTTHSRIVELDADARVEEIARMLGGIKITATTRQHAREMLGA